MKGTFFKFTLQWILNVFLKILKLKKRDENLWIFGAWGGDSYNDNSKYVFEYVSKYMPNINSVWITNNYKTKNQIVNLGYKCYIYNELNGRKARLNAKYVFYTNGMTDFGTYDLCHGAIIVALWHGMPLKRLLYATNNLQRRKRNILRFLQYAVLKIYNKSHRDFTIATSETTKDLLIKCFEVKPETVIISGQPRNDGLFNKTAILSLKQKLNHKPKDKFILYMPTWREIGNNEKFLQDILINLTNDSTFINSLIDSNIKLYIKPHPRITVNIKSIGNIIILKGISDFDTQNLIGTADVLITDYSSAFIDYALLERPTHFYLPDLDIYEKNSLGLFFSFEDFAEYWFTEIQDLKGVVLNSAYYSKLGVDNAKKVNSVFNDALIPKGEYTKYFITKFSKYQDENIQNK